MTEYASPPPDAADVARRAMILMHLHVHVLALPPREMLELTLAEAQDFERVEFLRGIETRHQALLDALRRTGLWEHVSPTERRILASSPLEISERDRVDVSWRAESIACLAWSLGLLDALPPYDVQVDPDEVLPLLPNDVTELTQTARLRPTQDIEAARDVAELWHWRGRTRQLQERGYRPNDGECALDDIVREVAARAANDSLFSPISADFPAFGKPYRELSSEEWIQAQSIAMERHFALNWICGFAPLNEWDETPTDT